MWPNWYSPPPQKPRQPYDWRETMRRVCSFYGVTPEEITGQARHRAIVDARWVLAKALQEKGVFSYPKIGQIIGGRDHTTIIHACREFPYRAKRRTHMLQALRKALAA